MLGGCSHVAVSVKSHLEMTYFWHFINDCRIYWLGFKCSGCTLYKATKRELFYVLIFLMSGFVVLGLASLVPT